MTPRDPDAAVHESWDTLPLLACGVSELTFMRVGADDFERGEVEGLLARPVAAVTRAVWGFKNRTDLIVLADGERVVLQCYRRRHDAEHRLRVLRALGAPAAEAGIPIPRVREFDLEAELPWVVFDMLPGAPATEADGGLEGARFPATARSMGALLSAFRSLSTAGLELDELWARPARLAVQATRWAEQLTVLSAAQRSLLAEFVDAIPALFDGRPVVLAHGDYAPVNVLIEDGSVTGLLDFEDIRLADPLFDVAWWKWAVSFSSASILDRAWPEFLHGAGVDAADPDLSARIASLQVLRMLELLAEDAGLSAAVQPIVLDRLRTMLS